MKKILILHTSIGLGHKSLAENIGAALAAEGFEVRLEDILKVQAGKLVNFGTKLHHFVNSRLPFIWSWLYKSQLVNFFTLPLRVPLASKNFYQTKNVIDEFKPDLVISVQTTASAIIAYLKKQGLYQGPFGIGFSDYHLHRYWLYDQADFYLANTEEQKQEMAALGIKPEKIFVCGMTIKPKMQVDARAVKEKLGLNLQDKIVLVGAGSLGIGFPQRIFEELPQKIDAAFIVVCGKNQKVFQALQKFCGPKFKVLGFHSPMAELYAISDLYVTKPGGLTVAESLQYQLPMIIPFWLPGQEELNCRYLSQKELVLLKPEDLSAAVKQELATGEFKKTLTSNPNVPITISEGQKVVAAVKKILD